LSVVDVAVVTTVVVVPLGVVVDFAFVSVPPFVAHTVVVVAVVADAVVAAAAVAESFRESPVNCCYGVDHHVTCYCGWGHSASCLAGHYVIASHFCYLICLCIYFCLYHLILSCLSNPIFC